MKRLILFLSALAAAFSLAAASVNEQRARKVAADFFAGADDWVRLPDAPAGCYVFNRKSGGFVIVSADDCTLPVLAYSHSGRFTLKDAPDNLRAWAESTSRVIRESAAKGRISDSRLQAVWDRPAVLSRAGEGTARLINTATWDQHAPFNEYAPAVDGEKSLTGCVALAMAIIMRHYRWPEKGSGVLPGYEFISEKGTRIYQNGHALGHSYNWADMPLNHVPADNRSVARLVYDCAIAIESAFNASGTSAYANDAPAKMAQYFGYSMSALVEQRSYYTTSSWMARIKAEIDAGRPVLYSAFSEATYGHAFVVDGYDELSCLHVNWGWKGSCNGYFSIDCFFPYAGDASREAEYGYYFRHAAAFDLVPDKSGSSRPKDMLCMRRSGDMQGLRLVSGTIAKDSPFRLEFGLCANRGNYSYSGGALRVGLVAGDGTLREFVGAAESVPLLEPNYGVRIYDYDARISAEPALGDVLKVFYRTGSDWEPMPYGLDDGTVGYLHAGPDIRFIQREAVYYRGEQLNPSLLFGNRPYVALEWYFDGVKCSERTPPLTQGTHRLKAVITHEDGSRETLLQEISVP